MALVTVLVCDQCGVQEAVQTYEIKKGDRKSRIDLCEQDGASLDELFNKGVKPTRGRTAAPRRGPSKTKVTTIDQIESMKKK